MQQYHSVLRPPIRYVVGYVRWPPWWPFVTPQIWFKCWITTYLFQCSDNKPLKITLKNSRIGNIYDFGLEFVRFIFALTKKRRKNIFKLISNCSNLRVALRFHKLKDIMQILLKTCLVLKATYFFQFIFFRYIFLYLLFKWVTTFSFLINCSNYLLIKPQHMLES